MFESGCFLLLVPILKSKKLEQLEFKLEKNNWDLETCRKVRKIGIIDIKKNIFILDS